MNRSARPRSPLPYGAVMATGGASHLADATGLHLLVAPLVWLAVAEAAAIPLLAAVRRRSVGEAVRCFISSAPAAQSFGDFTVPLGFAVIGIGLAGGSGQLLALACTATALAWLTTLALVVAVVAPVVVRPPGMTVVDGTWFLAPAAVLGDAAATASVVPHLPGAASPGLEWPALIGCAIGVIGYGLVVALAAGRVARVRIHGSPLSPWWISAGCGGLAAATIGQVAAVTPVARAAAGYGLAAVTTWGIGSALLIPVLVGSLAYLCRLRTLQCSPPWPPSFSTAVYALGALQTDRLCGLPDVGVVGRVAGLATVALWLVTAALYVALTPRRLHQQQ